MSADAAGRPKLLFIVTEDWFFCSHFLPMARAAVAEGFDVSVACRVRAHGETIEAAGCRVLSLEAERRSLNPLRIAATVADMRRLIAREAPDIVHLIALRSIMVGGLAARLAGVGRRVIALTGMGFLGAATDWKAKAGRAAVRSFVRAVADGRQARFLFENRSDPALLGLDPDDGSKLRIVGGAGVDPAMFAPQPMPEGPTFKLAMVARMLWSKGPDTAVEAVRLARRTGVDVTLSLYGAPDPSNPKAVAEATLRDWSRQDGVEWRGPVAQGGVPAVWAAHHAAALPSRGGEGLPRTLLEAAACGRPILTTDVPGCRDFVRDGIEGYLIRPGDAAALAERIAALAANRGRLAEMGAAARARVLDGHTEEAVGGAVARLYRDMLAR